MSCPASSSVFVSRLSSNGYKLDQPAILDTFISISARCRLSLQSCMAQFDVGRAVATDNIATALARLLCLCRIKRALS